MRKEKGRQISTRRRGLWGPGRHSPRTANATGLNKKPRERVTKTARSSASATRRRDEKLPPPGPG